MNSETKQCQNCKQDFVVESEDFAFYEKMKVLAPTFCPDCRLQRRLSWRNAWHLFRKTDFQSGEKIFSIFPEESPIKIYEKEYWNSDGWNPLEYGKDYDFSKPFFEQFSELLREVPLPANPLSNVVDSSYCTNVNDIKGCYLVIASSFTEDSAYLIWDQASKKSFDSHMTNNCELSYGNVNTISCYKTLFSVDCEDCVEVILCENCIGCNNCVGSSNLRNKSYYIFNKPYAKEEYLKELSKIYTGSEVKFEELKDRSYKNWLKYPHKYMHGRHNLNATGDYIYESKNAQNCYRVREVEDSKFIQNVLIGSVKGCYDYNNYGDGAELVYESGVVGSGISNIKFTIEGYPNVRNLTYCYYCNNSSDLFGCISLRNKKYCILNKQYTKEEYEELVPKIIEHMKSTGEYGEFFPSKLSPFSYEISEANEFFPLSKDDKGAGKFVWYPISKNFYSATLKGEKIPDNIKDTDENILHEIIECKHGGVCNHECVGAFRLIKREVDFCKQMNLPLPRICPNCRHYERLKQRNPFKLWHRQCMCDKSNHGHDGKCQNKFETSYAPDRPEIVYCESCYNNEVA